METKLILSLITLLGVVVTAFVTWLIAQRRMMGEHVTAERTKWRDRIRERALRVHEAIVSGNTDDASKLQNEFRALLNPFDQDDQEILHHINAKGSDDCREDRARDFGRLISLLLKQDWERAKLEAGFPLARWFVKAKRYSLECAYGKDGKRRPQTLSWGGKFEVKWKSGFTYLSLLLLLPVIVGLVMMWLLALGIALSCRWETTLWVWEMVVSCGSAS